MQVFVSLFRHQTIHTPRMLGFYFTNFAQPPTKPWMSPVCTWVMFKTTEWCKEIARLAQASTDLAKMCCSVWTSLLTCRNDHFCRLTPAGPVNAVVEDNQHGLMAARTNVLWAASVQFIGAIALCPISGWLPLLLLGDSSGILCHQSQLYFQLYKRIMFTHSRWRNRLLQNVV